MLHPEMPVFSFLCAFTLLIPLPWHWRARNVPTITMTIWLFITNIIRGINSIVWKDNVRIHDLVWCDISTKILIGVGVALPAGSMCILRLLEHVASSRVTTITKADKRRRMWVDLFWCIGVPLIIMALHYIVQGHRFDIIEYVGCQPNTYISWQGILIVWGVGLALAVVCFAYAALALHHFFRRRLEFAEHLKNQQTAMSVSRFFRLMTVAVSQMVWGTALTAYVLYLNVRDNGLRYYDSWKDVHSNFSRVAAFPSILIPTFYMDRLLLTWWIIPVTSILFVGILGFGEEAVSEYKRNYEWFRVNILRRPPRSTTATSSFSVMSSPRKYTNSSRAEKYTSTSQTASTISTEV